MEPNYDRVKAAWIDSRHATSEQEEVEAANEFDRWFYEERDLAASEALQEFEEMNFGDF